jgi:hypothetical protein
VPSPAAATIATLGAVRPGHYLSLLIALPLLAFPAGATADDFQQIFGDYKDDGQINDCYRPDQLHNAGRAIPPDIEQYAPGFGDALSSAQSRCGSSQPSSGPDEEEPPLISAGTPGPGVDIEKKKAVGEPPAPKVSAPPVPTDLLAPHLAPAGASVSSDTPGALIALLVAAGIAVLLALGWTIAWFMGWSPERLTKPLSAAFQSMWDRVLPGR